MTKQQIIENARHLPRNEQIDLAMEFWEAAEIADGGIPLTPEQREAINQRARAADKDPQAAEDVESLKARLLRGEF